MAGVYKGLKIQISADDGDLQRALDRNERQAGKLKRELKNVEKALKFDSTSPQMLASKMQKVSDQAGKTEERLKLLRQAESEIGKEKMTTDQWVNLQGEIAECEAKLRAYHDQLKELAATQAANGSVLGKAGNFLADNAETFQTVGDGMQKVGGLLTRTVTPAIVGGAAASVKAAVDIDTALTGVRKTVDGTEEDYQRLKDAAVEFSKTNATSATDFLDAQALGAQLGFAIDELQQFAEVATGLDIATNMDLETAGSEMARFANITKMSHGDIENYASAIVNVGNNMATTESEVSAMAMRIAAAGTQVGMSQADILGLAGALSSLGVEAEAGGTAISTVMASIDKEVATGGEGLETWASTARMSAEEFSAAWTSDPVQALSAVLSGMEEATAEGSNMSIMLEDLGISSLRQTDIMKRLAGNSQIMAEGVRIANDGWRENTALSEEVANRNDSMAAKFEMLKNRIVAVAEEVGAPIADALLEAVDAAEPLFEAIESGAKAFSEMSKEEQQAVLQAAGFLAVLGPMTSGVGKVVSSLGGAGNAMVSMAKGLAKVDMVGFAGDAGKAASAAATAGKAVEGAGVAAKAASVGMGALKASVALLIVAGLALAIKEAKDFFDHMKLVEEATDGVRDAMQGSFGSTSPKDAFDAAAEGADGYRNSLDELRSSQQEALEANSKLADSIKDAYAEIGDKNSIIDNFKRSLDDLEGSAEPTERQLADTKIAIDQMNEAFGTSFQLSQDADGHYTVITEEAAEAARQIDELRGGLGENAQLTEDQLADLQEKVAGINEQFGTTYEVAGNAEEGYRIVGSAADGAREKVDNLLESLKAQNAYEAFSGLAEESSAALQTASSNLQKQQAALADAEEYLAGLQSRLIDNPNDLMLEGEVLAATSAVEGLKQTVSEAEGAYQSAATASEAFAAAQNLMQQALNENASALTKAISGNDLLVNSFVGAGKDIASFKGTLESVGVEAETLSGIGSKEASQLARAYDGSFSSIESLLATFGVHVDEQARNATKAAEENARAAKEVEDSWREAFASIDGTDFDFVAQSVGESAEELSAKLDQCGLSVEDLAMVGADGFARLYESADGNVEAVMDTLARLNDMGIDPKEFVVNDDGTIADTHGQLIDLDSMTIDGKPFYVDDNGTILFFLGQVQELDERYVQDKDFRITDDGTVVALNDEIAKFDGVKIGDKYYKVVTEGAREAQQDAENVESAAKKVPERTDTTLNADDRASSKISDVDRNLRNLDGKSSTVNVYANTSPAWSSLNALTSANLDRTMNVYVREVKQNAAGGILPRHMAGGIFTGPTLTNIGLVGEAGAEAWFEGPGGSGALVPLTNRRYVRPFAQAVAAEMGGGGQTVNNYYTINGMNYLPDSRVGQLIGQVFDVAFQESRM